MKTPTLCYGPAYDPSRAPFPDALSVAPLPEFPKPAPKRPAFTTSTARRPKPRRSIFAALVDLLTLAHVPQAVYQ